MNPKWIAGIFAILAAILTASPTLANEWFTVTDCKVITVDGQEQQEVTFDFHNAGTLTVYEFDIWTDLSAPEDTCHIVAAPSNENWLTFRNNDGGYTWSVSTAEHKVRGGETSVGIKATFSRTNCCWHAAIFGVVIDPYAVTDFCTPCLTTPARSSTWGRLKSQYR